MSGKTEEATEVWRQGFEANPDDRSLLEALDRLAPGLKERLQQEFTASSVE